MGSMSKRSVRTQAAMFLVATAPATTLIVLAGGLVGFAPVLFLLIALLVVGRLPGDEALQRLIERWSPKRPRAPRRAAKPLTAPTHLPLCSPLIASALAARGPPPRLAPQL
jgi:hypothetical protein